VNSCTNHESRMILYLLTFLLPALSLVRELNRQKVPLLVCPNLRKSVYYRRVTKNIIYVQGCKKLTSCALLGSTNLFQNLAYHKVNYLVLLR
jgi:hypothetical protein